MLSRWLAAPLLAAGAAGCTFDPPSGGSPDPGAPDGGLPDGAIPDAPCADDDGDTICNAADRCATGDDRLDADQDQIPDACDDWPCGARPDDPGDPMLDGAPGRGWSAALISIGQARRLVASPGESFSAVFAWTMFVDCGVPAACPAQLEVGYGAQRTGCVAELAVASGTATTGAFGGSLRAPAAPGPYELRLNAARNAACGTGDAWFGGDPGPESTIAYVCVRP
jgi:hypothetical protein